MQVQPEIAGGLCRQVDPEAVFPSTEEPPTVATRMWARCPAAAECLEYVLANDERFGIWGATSSQGRRRVRRRGGPEVLA